MEARSGSGRLSRSIVPPDVERHVLNPLEERHDLGEAAWRRRTGRVRRLNQQHRVEHSAEHRCLVRPSCM
jgi:hypothetical protein